MSDEIDLDVDEQKLPPVGYGQELSDIAKRVRDDNLKEWNGDSDADEYVELTPDGQAVVDGAFSPLELYRIAEAASEVQRRCAPAIGHDPLPPLESAPLPMSALHRLRFVLGPSRGDAIDQLVSQAEHGVAIRQQEGEALLHLSRTRQLQIEVLSHKLDQVRAVCEAERMAREAGGSVLNPAVMDELLTALQAMPAEKPS